MIYGLHSGRYTDLPEALTELRQADVAIVDSIPISKLQALPPQGELWRERGIDLVIAAGGDGLIGGLLPHVASGHLPLGILPLGTSNNTARSLHIPLDIPGAIATITLGQERDIDLGIAYPIRKKSLASQSWDKQSVNKNVTSDHIYMFAHALAVGLNTQFARIATDVATRERYGPFTYAFASIKVLQNPRVFEVELSFEGLSGRNKHPELSEQMQRRGDEDTAFRCRAFQVAVVNTPVFGGERQWSIPRVKLGDGLLDIVVIEEQEFAPLMIRLTQFLRGEEREFGFLGNGLAEVFGQSNMLSTPQASQPFSHTIRLTDIPGIHHIQARGVTITTHSAPEEVTLDGELCLQTPLAVHVAPQRLRVLAPDECEYVEEGKSPVEATLIAGSLES